VTEAEMPRLTSDEFRYWVIDRPNKKIRVVLRDGNELSSDIESSDPILTSEVALTAFDWDKRWVESVTKRGHFIACETYNPLDADPLRGRPSVYLDQNHWSTVAQALLDPSRIKDGEKRDAATELARLASDVGVVTPLSAGHLRETAALNGDRRYEVGCTMATLAGGWQMRHPT
jgi:hypothetical protein